MKQEIKLFFILLGVFLFGYLIPFESDIIRRSFHEAFLMFQEYTQEHILTCLIPAFFIAGAMSVFLSQEAIIKYFGASAKKWMSYSVASISGTILSVCSCTVLPLFAGIYKKGAGIGPATAFLYSGPSINVLAVLLTFKILGFEIGLARFIGAVVFAVLIGLLMGLFFSKEDNDRNQKNAFNSSLTDEDPLPLWKKILHFLGLILLLIVASWGEPKAGSPEIFFIIYTIKWYVAGVLFLVILGMSIFWMNKDDNKLWMESSWDFAKKILPLLFGGVLVAGFLMGRPGHDALIPYNWIAAVVGDNSILSSFIASLAGGLMYFATLTEIPILESLMGAGMAKGPALSLLLAGPAISLPNMLVIRSVLGTKKTVVYITLVVLMATISGWLYGTLI